MVNFTKIKRLISEVETQSSKEQRYFFERLKAIAECELALRQVNLNGFFGG